MKSTLISPPVDKVIPEFPLLAILKQDSPPFGYKVVLFQSEKKGTLVVNTINDYHKIGHQADDWISVFDPKTWTILPKGAAVTLEV